ncbi:MAG: ribbon-helix-helix protein, CopG family [Bryobacterales bacterium]
MASTSIVTVRLDEDLKRRLEALAQGSKRSRSFLAAEAIAQYLEREAWQIEETQKALQEADAGDFATDAEADAVFSKWSE